MKTLVVGQQSSFANDRILLCGCATSVGTVDPSFKINITPWGADVKIVYLNIKNEGGEPFPLWRYCYLTVRIPDKNFIS